MPSINNIGNTTPNVMNLAATSSTFQQLIQEWESWASMPEPGAGEQREWALGRLKACIFNETTQLDLANLSLTTLPENLPPRIRTFSCSNNQLTHLPENMPDSLQFLIASDNQLTALPSNLPINLFELYLDNNRLTVLPDNLHQGLRVLQVGQNQLTHLPENLPDSLRLIGADGNQLINLPTALPTNLRILCVGRNRLGMLPINLPNQLESLNLQNNQLTRLPVNLPNSLQLLEVQGNRLLNLPPRLPTSLNRLNVENNLLSSLPNTLPPSLYYLNALNNPITQFPFIIPPSLHTFLASYRIDVQTDRNPQLIDAVQLWDKNANPSQWQSIQAEEDALIFASFLHKLNQGLNTNNSVLQNRVLHWLNHLLKDENSVLRQQTFRLAQQADASCVDRASFYFNKMYLLMSENEMIQTIQSQSIEEVIGTALSFFRLGELERIAEKHVKRRQLVSPSFDEDIEIYLAYQYKLRAEFSLPVYTELQYAEIAGVTNEDVMNAKTEILTREKESFLRYLVMESPTWQARIQNWSADKKKIMEENYSAEVDSDAFKEMIDKEIKQIMGENDSTGVNSDEFKEINDKAIGGNVVENARREISTRLAENLLYKKRYELTKEFLLENRALSLLDKYENHPV